MGSDFVFCFKQQSRGWVLIVDSKTTFAVRNAGSGSLQSESRRVLQHVAAPVGAPEANGPEDVAGDGPAFSRAQGPK